MLKKIVRLVFIFLIFFCSKAYSDFIICDSWNINFEWKTVSEMCNWWYENLDISTIEYFTWSFINLDSWFWWGKQNFEFWNNENLPIWFFDANKKTVIENVNPNYDFSLWFIWTNNSFSWIIINVENNYPVWFFDSNKKTIILKTDLVYDFPVWYIWNFVVKSKWWARSSTPIVKDVSYKEFFYEILKKNINSEFLNKYSKKELDLFINNLLDLLLEWEKGSWKIISEESKDRIKLSIKNSNFSDSLNKLIENLDSINIVFKNTNSETQKFYVIKYYLD